MDTPIESIVREHGPRLRALATHLVGDGDDADEIVQRAWVAAWRARPTSPKAWLERVVRRAAARLRRDASSVRAREMRAARPESVPDAAASLERREALQALAASLAALPSELSEVVLLRHADGLPPREIASRLGIPVNTVRSRATRGLNRLRDGLDRAHGEWRSGLALIAVPRSPLEPAAPVWISVTSAKTIAAIALIAAAVLAVPMLTPGRAAPAIRGPRGDAQAGAAEHVADVGRESYGERMASSEGRVEGMSQVEGPSGLHSVQDCVRIADPARAAQCIDEWLVEHQVPSLGEIGDLICYVGSPAGSPGGRVERSAQTALTTLLVRTLRARAHEDLLTGFDSMYRSCPRASTVGYFVRAVRDLRDEDPGMLDHIRVSLCPERVFDPGSSVAAVRLAVEIARELDDLNLRKMLCDGGLGRFGGTPDQVDRAASAAYLLEAGDESVAYAEALLANPFLADGSHRPGLGATLAVLLTGSKIAGSCEEGRVVEMLEAALEDVHVGEGVALQIVRHMTDRPPQGISAGAWTSVRGRAQEVLDASGLHR